MKTENSLKVTLSHHMQNTTTSLQCIRVLDKVAIYPPTSNPRNSHINLSIQEMPTFSSAEHSLGMKLLFQHPTNKH